MWFFIEFLFWSTVTTLTGLALYATYLCYRDGRALLRERKLRRLAERQLMRWSEADEEIAQLEALWRMPCHPGYLDAQ